MRVPHNEIDQPACQPSPPLLGLLYSVSAQLSVKSFIDEGCCKLKNLLSLEFCKGVLLIPLIEFVVRVKANGLFIGSSRLIIALESIVKDVTLVVVRCSDVGVKANGLLIGSQGLLIAHESE
jgi:hypothetical protein